MKFESITEDVLSQEGSAFFYTPPYYRNSFSYIFRKPLISLRAGNKEELFEIIAEADKLRKKYHGYSVINYEAGYLLEEKLKSLSVPGTAAEFIFFDESNYLIVPSSDISIDYSHKKGGTDDGYEISSFSLNTPEDEYCEQISSIKNYIRRGDTYQVNYTIKGKFDFKGSVGSLFRKMLFNQSAEYAALINGVGSFYVSLSPELFFTKKGKSLITKPMKGTIKRGYNSASDNERITELKNSSKDKAENIMIVDLLRNDVGRISETGSVTVPSLFKIEKYESLFQMVSAIEGKVPIDTPLEKIIRSLFPCGSITGAPKISTMEIINKLEKEQRGIYTGSIGMLDRNRIIYNVAIRTLVIKKNQADETLKGEIGIGGGIVWDSEPKKEYQECLLKCNFLLKPMDYFELFETMRVEKGKIFLLKEHLERLKKGAKFFLFKYDEPAILKKLSEILKKTDKGAVYKLKVTLGKSGSVGYKLSVFRDSPGMKKVILSDKTISTENRFQYYKTTNRELYNREFEWHKSKYVDVLFLNERGEIAEGAVSNFCVKLNGKWYTPPLKSGILNGVYRKYLIARGELSEKVIYPFHMLRAENMKIINSLRKGTFVSVTIVD